MELNRLDILKPNPDEINDETSYHNQKSAAKRDNESPSIEVREKWSSKIDFLLSTIGLCVGLGNIWRFPYLCYENGGGVFLIPYLLTLIFAGIPILFLEMSVGQMKSIGGLGVWKYCPIFKGVGYAAVIMAFLLSIYYIMILAYALVYIQHSFTTDDLPWSSCDQRWNTHCCVKFNQLLQNETCLVYINSKKSKEFFVENKTLESICPRCDNWNAPVVEFWENNILKESPTIHEMGWPDAKLAVALFIAWLLCYFCIWKGVKWTGKVVYFTALFPYFCLICLFFRGVTLEGSGAGISYYLNPRISLIFQSKVWLDAATQIFFSYGLGLGTHIALGSYNSYRNNCHRDALIIGVINASTSLFSGFVVFSVLGNMAYLQQTTVDNVAQSGPGLVFLAYPAALSTLPGAAFWSILFFFMIILIGLDSQFCTLEGFITAIIDEWPQRWRKNRKLLIFLICALSYLIGLAFTFKNGSYIFRLFDHYSASGMALLFLIFCECIAFSWCYGVNRFMNDCENMLGFKLSLWWKYCWLIFCPVVCLCVMLITLIYYKHVTYKDREFPIWAHSIGVILALSSVIMVPIYFIYYFITQYRKMNTGFNKITILEILRPTIQQIEDRNSNYI